MSSLDAYKNDTMELNFRFRKYWDIKIVFKKSEKFELQMYMHD